MLLGYCTLSGLVRSLLIQNAERHITERAEAIAQSAAALAAALSERWEVLFVKQGTGRRLQRSNTLMWNRDWGWKITPNVPAQAYWSGYIELEAAATAYPEIQDAVKRLLEVCR